MPVIAASTPSNLVSNLRLIDQAIESFSVKALSGFDLIGISVHTLNAKRAYDLIREIKAASDAKVIVGGVHATIFPEEVLAHGADAVVTGDGETVWAQVVTDASADELKSLYSGGRVQGEALSQFPAWQLMNLKRYLMATVQTTRGCPERCSFCSVWRTDGRTMRFRSPETVVGELRQLYDAGFRVITLADDNFYGVGEKNADSLKQILDERYRLMDAMASSLPKDLLMVTQTTIRTADDPKFLTAMRNAQIRGVLVGVESYESEGLNSINKNFNMTGDDVGRAIRAMQMKGIYTLGSHILGLPSDDRRALTNLRLSSIATKMAFAQFLNYTIFPGTVDFELATRDRLGVKLRDGMEKYWLRQRVGEKGLMFEHPNLSSAELFHELDCTWNSFYSYSEIVKRARSLGIKSPFLFIGYIAISRFFKRMFYDFGVATDSARTSRLDVKGRIFGWIARLAMKRRARAKA